MASGADAQPPEESPVIPLGPAAGSPAPLQLDRDALRTLMAEVLAETVARPPTELPDAPLSLPARRLAGDQAPELVATFSPPAPYEHLEFTFWVNPPDGVVQAVNRARPRLAPFLTYFLRDWNLRFAPDAEHPQGEPVPVAEEHWSLLAESVLIWVRDEFGRQRLHPLVGTNTATSATEREPHLAGGTGKSSRNGSA